ncbi:MAG: DUF4020 domain-containing protein [candidate division Zixibacteria bacterium]|nr:DUF4020 domain-containing protein [candidate division Zixibacteria bacterium]
MRFGVLDIPDELLEAQKNNKLVIFAGAGISINSGLPDFPGLVNETEKHFNFSGNEDFSSDRRLGILERKSKQVHEFVYNKFNVNIEPSSLHESLLRVFRKDQAIKLVTTNYDNLFSTANENLSRIDTPHYYAPALPPGDTFEGIVYVHGGVATKKPKDLVMTDIDFGRAYLTEGWARRFLVRMFEKHTVLFWGYSLEDDLLKYLSSALPTDSRRYSISRENEESKWKVLGITPIVCPVDERDKFHNQAEKSLKKWGESIHGGYVWAEIRIREIVENYSDPDPAEREIILNALKELPTTRFFCNNANDPSWLNWLDENNVMESLFDPQCKLSKPLEEISKWIAVKFTIPHHKHVLDLIHKHSDVINPSFWSDVLLELSRAKERSTPDVLGPWVTILLKDVPPQMYRPHNLEFLLTKRHWSEDKYIILQLFSYLLMPIAKSERTIRSIVSDVTDYKYDYQLTLRGKEYYLRETWNQLKPHIGNCWHTLLPTVQKYLTDAYNMNVANNKSGGDEDTQSWWRSAIENHEQDENSHRSFNVLIDVARDMLVYFLKTDELESKGKSLIELWFDTEVPLLRRIAIHGVAVDERTLPDDKISWLIDKKLIYRHNYKHDVFQVIKNSLGECNNDIIKKIINIVVNPEPKTLRSGEEIEIREYEKYNLLNWMRQFAPKSEIVKWAFKKITDDNPNFLPREHPDFDVWTGEFQLIPPISSKSVEELIEMPIPEVTEYLIKYEDDESREHEENRDGLLQELTHAVITRFDWSMQLANVLIEKQFDNDKEREIWHSLIKGWEKSTLSNKEWQGVILFLSKHKKIHAPCELLVNVIKKGEELSDEVFDALEELSDLIWIELVKLPSEEKDSRSWLKIAINHGAGKLGEFWLLALHQRFIKNKEIWDGIPKDYLDRFERAISDETSYSAQLVRCILASRIHYIHMHKRKWTKDNLLPIFDFKRDELTAKQAWHGFLILGKDPYPIIDEFKQFYVQAIDKIEDIEDRLRERLYKHIFWIFDVGTDNSCDFNWFYQILAHKSTTEKDLEYLTNELWVLLRKKESLRKSVWDRWLKKYWSDRNGGNPKSLEPFEANRLIECLPLLAAVFKDAVDIACKTKGFDLTHTSLYADLVESELLETHSADVFRLLNYLLDDGKVETFHQDSLFPLYESLKEVLGENEVIELREHLTRLGVL